MANKGVMVVGGLAAGALLVFLLTRKAGAAPPPPPPPGKANLYGKVTDAATGQPISGVLAILDSLTTLTDSVGNYLFTDLNPGGYSLQFSKDGYETAIF